MASPLVAAFWTRLLSIWGLVLKDVLSLTVAGDGRVSLKKACRKRNKTAIRIGYTAINGFL